MMKKIFFICLVILNISATAAAEIPEGTPIAVMDFGVLKTDMEENLSLKNLGLVASEYIIERLVDTKYFQVVDKDSTDEEFKKQNLKIFGLFDPNYAKESGELLGVRYLIYGNVTDVSLDEDIAAVVTVNKVKARVTARIFDVETDRILMAAKGEGKSESALVTLDDKIAVTIGTKKVSQVSVHNAIKKAAFQSVDILLERLLGKSEIEKLFGKK